MFSSRRMAVVFAGSLTGLCLIGCAGGVPEADIVTGVRAGDVAAVRALLARDPALVQTRVYPQAYERRDQRRAFEAREGRSPWEGRLLIHEAAARVESPRPLLDLLADAGADLTVRLNGRTLLHLAARDGNLEVASWLLERGVPVNGLNDCADCAEAGWAPLHDAQAFRDDEMSERLLAAGATADPRARDGRTPLHVAAVSGKLGGAFVLCRHGADPTRTDAAGHTPFDLAGDPGVTRDPSRVRVEDLPLLVKWLQPDGGCAAVAAKARAAGRPVPDEEARTVFARTVGTLAGS
ncbi:MAG: ankyrin repeat domain-containing protein [Vicinamibacterales bacterium]